MTTAKTTQVLCAALIFLGACTPEVILPGERVDARSALITDAVTTAAQENASAPISLPRAQNLDAWAQLGGDARHSSPHGALSSAPVLAWSVKIGSGNTRGARISAAPVVQGARVFAMDNGGQVTAVARDTGDVLWQASIQPEFDGSTLSGGGLAVGDGRVYASTGAGEVIALDGASGATLWRHRLTAPAAGAPMIAGNAVYVLARDGAATALNTSNGRILWTADGLGKTTGVLGAGTAALDGGRVILPFAGGQIFALGPDGDTLWIATLAGKRLGRAYAGFGDVTGDPVVVGNTVYVGSSAGRTAALDAATGTPIWTAPEGAMNAPLVVGGSVFVVNDQSKLVRIDARTGEVIWGWQMPYFKSDRPRRIKAITAHYGPVLAGGNLIVASGDGSLRLFDPASGAIRGQVDIAGGAASAPALAGGMLFVMGAGGQLHAFR